MGPASSSRVRGSWRGPEAAPRGSFRRWPTWLVIAFMWVLYLTNKSMQRFTAKASSPGAMRDAKENFDAMMRTARELEIQTPSLASLGQYLEASAVTTAG